MAENYLNIDKLYKSDIKIEELLCLGPKLSILTISAICFMPFLVTISLIPKIIYNNTNISRETQAKKFNLFDAVCF